MNHQSLLKHVLKDAANILAVPIGTVRSRLSRAREALRVLVGMVEEPAEHQADRRDQTRSGEQERLRIKAKLGAKHA